MSSLLLVLLILLIGNSVSSQGSDNSLASDLFGSTLYRWDTSDKSVVEETTDSLLQGKKVVGVYFSASWCGPCQQFTPLLADFYARMKKEGKSFEVVWVSRDRSPQEFLEYYKKMPWLAVTWENYQRIGQKLGALYQMKGIPHLAILHGDDYSLLTSDGRSQLIRDKYGLEFPWRPRTLLALIPKPVKKFFAAKLQSFSQVCLNFLSGVIEGVAPKKLLQKLQAKGMQLAKELLKQGIEAGRLAIESLLRMGREVLEKQGILATQTS